MRENGKISEFPLFAFNFWYNKCQLIHASWDNFPSRPLSYRVRQIWVEYIYFALTRRLCPAFDQMLKGGSAGPMTRVLLAPRSARVGAGIPAGGFGFRSRNAPSIVCEEDPAELCAKGVAAGGGGGAWESWQRGGGLDSFPASEHPARPPRSLRAVLGSSPELLAVIKLEKKRGGAAPRLPSPILSQE